MEAIKKIKKVKEYKITVTLPKSLEAKKVEVTVRPLLERKGIRIKSRNNKLSEYLLTCPTFTKEEIKTLKEFRTYINRFSVQT